MNLVFAKDMIPRKPKRAYTCDSKERLRWMQGYDAQGKINKLICVYLNIYG